MTDPEWDRIKPLLPNADRKRTHSLREVINALLLPGAWRRQLAHAPHDFPPWETVYGYFNRWTKAGVLAVGEDRGKRGIRGYDAGKKVQDRERHIVVDTTGFPLAVVVHAASSEPSSCSRSCGDASLGCNSFGLTRATRAS